MSGLSNRCCDALGCRSEIEAELEKLKFENLTLRRKLAEAEAVIEHVNHCGVMAGKAMKREARKYIPYDTGLQPKAPGQK